MTSLDDLASLVLQNISSVDFVTIPPIYKGYGITYGRFPNATTIGANAFAGCAQLSELVAPNIATIGTGAFSNCTALKSFDFSSVTSIGSNAINGCSFESVVDLRNVRSLPSLGTFAGTVMIGKAGLTTALDGSPAGAIGSVMQEKTMVIKAYGTMASGDGSNARFVSTPYSNGQKLVIDLSGCEQLDTVFAVVKPGTQPLRAEIYIWVPSSLETNVAIVDVMKYSGANETEVVQVYTDAASVPSNWQGGLNVLEDTNVDRHFSSTYDQFKQAAGIA